MSNINDKYFYLQLSKNSSKIELTIKSPIQNNVWADGLDWSNKHLSLCTNPSVFCSEFHGNKS